MNKKFWLALLCVVMVLFTFVSCSEADRVNYNISKQADYFGSARKITVYNTWTDTIFMELEGYMSISNNEADELVVTCKVGPDQYKKNYIYLNQFVTYVVEDLGTDTDPYHYKWVIDTHLTPSVELK